VEKQKHPGCAHYVSGISIALFETLEQSKQISLNCYDISKLVLPVRAEMVITCWFLGKKRLDW